MGFINYYQDNFLQSNSPWGDDNVTHYTVPPKSSTSDYVQPRDMGYEQIEELINQFTEMIPSLDAADASRVDQKLTALKNEKRKRDELETATRVEREDAFEPVKTTLIEDAVVPDKTRPVVIKSDVKQPFDLEEELLDLELDDLLTDSRDLPTVQTAGIGDVDNFLIASFIVIAVILITK